MICPRCNETINDQNASFCPACGQSLSEVGTAAKKKRGHVVAIAVVAVVAIIAVVVAALLYVNAQNDKNAHTTHAVKIAVSVEESDGDTTNIPVSVEGTDLDGGKVSETCYVDSSGEGIELMQGTYTISFPASPLAADGSIWKAPGETISFTIDDSIGAGAAFDCASSSTVKFTKVDAIDVTDEEIELAYKYAAGDPEFKSVASTYRDAATKARDDAVKEQQEQVLKQEAAKKKAEFQSRLDALDNMADNSGSMTTQQMAQEADSRYGKYDALLSDVLDYAKTLTTNAELTALVNGEAAWESQRQSSMTAAGQGIPSGFSASLERLTCGFTMTSKRIQTLLDAM